MLEGVEVADALVESSRDAAATAGKGESGYALVV